jgi:hypothetical protein
MKARGIAGFLLGLFVDHEDGGDIFLRNIDWFQRTTWRYIPKDNTVNIKLDVKKIGPGDVNSVEMTPMGSRAVFFVNECLSSRGHTVSLLVEALSYKPEGRRFDFR